MVEYQLSFSASAISYVLALLDRQPHGEVVSFIADIKAEVARQDKARHEQERAQLLEAVKRELKSCEESPDAS